MTDPIAIHVDAALKRGPRQRYGESREIYVQPLLDLKFELDCCCNEQFSVPWTCTGDFFHHIPGDAYYQPSDYQETP